MMRVLVHIEIHQDAVSGSARELVTVARRLAGAAGRVEALIAHASPEKFTAEVGAVDEAILVRHEALAEYNPEAQLACIEAAAAERRPDLVLFAYTSAGLDLGPSAAARLGLPLAGYCTSLEPSGAGLEATCQIYGGKLNATIALPLPAIVMMTPGSAREDTGSAASTTELPAPAALGQLRTKVLSVQAPDPDAVDITKADRLVCVGRGIGGKDNIGDAEELAALMGGEIAGSRPVIDAGWLPKERQVGKSGRKVKPRLYMALGVSGAPEHLEGMGASELIVAINSDARAPIFAHAHYGATVDLFDFIEAMKARLDA